MFLGCYVPYPSVGIKPTKVYYQEYCAQDTNSGLWRCTQIRKYVRNK